MKKRRRDTANMFFSAFLVLAYVVCAYFLFKLCENLTNATLNAAIILLIVAGFGLFLFYATRVGDGKQVLRFSPVVLIMLVLPSVYVICAFFAVGLPLHDEVYDCEQVLYIAAITLGYSIPYTFTSGYEMVSAEDVFMPKDDDEDERELDEDEATETAEGKNEDKPEDTTAESDVSLGDETETAKSEEDLDDNSKDSSGDSAKTEE